MWRYWEEQCWWHVEDKKLIRVSSRENRRGIENVEYILVCLFQGVLLQREGENVAAGGASSVRKGLFVCFSRWGNNVYTLTEHGPAERGK